MNENILTFEKKIYIYMKEKKVNSKTNESKDEALNCCGLRKVTYKLFRTNYFFTATQQHHLSKNPVIRLLSKGCNDSKYS